MKEPVVTAPDLLEGAVELRDLLAPRYGPMGQQMLIETADGVVVTSDLHRFLDTETVMHPAGALVAAGAVQQKEHVGDGSLTVVLLTGGLAERASALLEEGLHRTTIASGYAQATEVALDALETLSNHPDPSNDATVREVARTALSADLPTIDDVVTVLVEAARLIDDTRRGTQTNTNHDIQFRHVPGDGRMCVELLRGAIVEREPVHPEMPTELDSPRVAVIGGGKKAGTGIEERSLKREGGSKGKGRTEVTLDVDSYDAVEAFRDYEVEGIEEQVRALTAVGVDVVFCTMGISDEAKHQLNAAGITAFRSLPAQEARRIARATGASVVMDLSEVTDADVGRAGSLRVVNQNTNPYVRLDDCPETSIGTVLLTGALGEAVEELERDLRTAIVSATDVLQGRATVAAGGGIECSLARVVRDAARGHGGREALAMEAYADALEDIPRTLVRNAGLNPLDVLTTLRTRGPESGFDCHTGGVRVVVPDGPQLPARVVQSSLTTSTDIAVQLVRIDEVLPARRDNDDITDVDLTPDPERDVAT